MGYFKGSEHWILTGDKAEQRAARQDMALKIAQKLTGMYDWQGVKESEYGPAGLLSEIRKAIKNNPHFANKNTRIGEDVIIDVNDYTQGESRYYIVSM